jgi:hypothetical protein
MTLPITFGEPPMRSTPPLCIACAEGDHELKLRAHEPCTCPCHGIAVPEAVAA